MNFVSSDRLVSRIKTTYLKSFSAAGLIVEDDFYLWIKDCLHELGLGAMIPATSILTVDRYKATIPKDLVEFYSIHRLTAHSPRPPQRHFQNASTWYLDTTVCDYSRKKCCGIEEEGVKVTFSTYFEESEQCYQYKKAGLLRYIPNRGTHFIGDKCHKSSPCSGNKYQHLFHPNVHEREFHISGNHFQFNFTDEEIYLQYHAFPLDDGLPMIPDVPQLQTYIQDTIIYNVLYVLWLNSDAPDLERKKADAERKMIESKSNAISWIKLPSFKTILAYKQHQTSNFAPFERFYL